MKTGVIQPLPGIGDMIWFLPALRALAASSPDGKITLYTRSKAQAGQLLGHEAMIERLVTLPDKRRGLSHALPDFWRTWRVLMKNRPDRLFILHQSGRYRMAARLAGIRNITAYDGSLARSKENGWIKSLSFLHEQGIPVADSTSRLTAHPDYVEEVTHQFVQCPRPWIAVAPGASAAERLWPAQNFAECVDFLADKTGGTLFLIGAPNEKKILHDVQAGCRNAEQTEIICGLPFSRVMALLSCCELLLGNDSGPANVAAALGKPAVMLCGTSMPALHSPHMIILKPETGTGMAGITPAQVIAVLKETMAA